MTTQTPPGLDLPPAARAHELRFGRPLAQVLTTDYADWTMEAVAADFGVSTRTMHRWMRVLGVERRFVLVHAGQGSQVSEDAGQTAETAEAAA